MKIALVHEYLTNFAGSERVLLALHELFPEAPIYTAIYNPKKCPQFKNADIRTSFLQNFPMALERYQVYIPLLPLAVESYDLLGYDLVISDCHIATKGVITKPNTIHICYCHTPIRYAWSPAIDPRSSGSMIRRLASHYLRLWDLAAAKLVDYWLANSNYVASRIKKFYRAESMVIYPPVDLPTLKQVKQIEDYYVFFSRLIDYKKPDMVVRAFNRLGKKLVVIGRGPMTESLKQLAGPTVEIITDYLPSAKLISIFSKSAAMIFPAEEDFGLAMVEFMASGRPVIAYDAGGAREIIKPGKTGEFFSQQTVESIESAVASFDPMKYDSREIRRRAETFSSNLFKKRIKSFIHETVNSNNQIPIST